VRIYCRRGVSAVRHSWRVGWWCIVLGETVPDCLFFT
jgi:hypothetical protein